MTLFEYLQSCSIEEFAEFLVTLCNESEDHIIRLYDKQLGYPTTKIQLSTELQITNMITLLNTEG